MHGDKLASKIDNCFDWLVIELLKVLSLAHPAASMIVLIETLFERAAGVAAARVL